MINFFGQTICLFLLGAVLGKIVRMIISEIIVHVRARARDP
jgi:hypothetical protein